MARTKYGKTRTIPYRRKRQSRTNYKKRLALLKSGQNRLVIRRSLNTITTQIIAYSPDGDKVVASATSKELNKMGWKAHKANIPSAYLTGLLLGTKAKKKNIKKVVFDLGLQIPIKGGRLFAALKGVVDAGMEINHDEEALPSEERIAGKHIAEYASKLKADQQKYAKQFSRYTKDNINPEDLCKIFDETKKKVLSA
jgi:large subunit ribosomal protein L18